MYLGNGATSLTRTLISGNSAALSSGSEIYSGFPRSFDYFNLFGHSGLTTAQALVGITRGPRDITATSDGSRPTALTGILDTTLTANGGPTQTHALVAGSPAIDTARPLQGTTCSATDQRGFGRPVDGDGNGAADCDIGSFEFDGIAPPPPTVCNGAPITIFGTNGNDVITGTPGRDVIHALAGNDRVSSLAGDDVVCGGDGNDFLQGGPQNDVLDGEQGNDRLFGVLGSDRLLGGTGNDELFGGDHADILSGGAGTDLLIGGNDVDFLVGNEGDDTLLGSDGNDRLFGQADDDQLFGGEGDDALNGGLSTDRCDGQGGGGDSAVACETVVNVP